MDNIKFWRYYIPPVDRIEGWGIFLLDSTGMFAAVTDYGNYAYMWDHHGKKDFREFVAGLAKSPYYVLGKVAKKDYSGKETIKAIKEDILDNRRDGSYTKEFARREWDLLKNTDDMDSVFGFKEWYDNTHVSDASELYSMDWSLQAKAFATKLMPRLAEALKDELRKESEVCQSA